jgi:hypothetical protein
MLTAPSTLPLATVILIPTKSAAERSQRLTRSSGLILVKHETESMSGTSITSRYITVTIAVVMTAPQMLGGNTFC